MFYHSVINTKDCATEPVHVTLLHVFSLFFTELNVFFGKKVPCFTQLTVVAFASLKSYNNRFSCKHLKGHKKLNCGSWFVN